MSRAEAELILRCWIACPVQWEGGCQHEDEYRENECWTQEQVTQAVEFLLDELRWEGIRGWS